MQFSAVNASPNLNCAHSSALPPPPISQASSEAASSRAPWSRAKLGLQVFPITGALVRDFPLFLALPLWGWGQSQEPLPREMPIAGHESGRWASGVKSHWGAICGHPAGPAECDSERQEWMQGVRCQAGGNRYQLRMRAVGLAPPCPSESRGCNQNVRTTVNSPGFPIRGIPGLLSLRTRPSMSRVRLGKRDSRASGEMQFRVPASWELHFPCQLRLCLSLNKAHNLFLMQTHSYQGQRSTVDIQLVFPSKVQTPSGRGYLNNVCHIVDVQ